MGTAAARAALTPWQGKITIWLGLAFGYGLRSDICDAYLYLMNNFEPGDRVFQFGFSRGAYAVRAIAGLLHTCGLIGYGNDPLAPYAVKMLNAISRAHERNEVGEAFHLANGFKSTFSIDCKPFFVGVWDTVSSVGQIYQRFHAAYTANNPDIAVARHAVAIDERRAFFLQNLFWPKEPRSDPGSGPKDLLQVWFPGDHCAVGGGYPEAESGQSKYALEWMLAEATRHGLLCDRHRLDAVLGQINGTDRLSHRRRRVARCDPVVPPSQYQAMVPSRKVRFCLSRVRTGSDNRRS